MNFEKFEKILDQGIFFDDFNYTMFYKHNYFVIKDQYNKIIHKYNIDDINQIIVSNGECKCFIILLFHSYHDSYSTSKHKLILSFSKQKEKRFIQWFQEWIHSKYILLTRNDYL